MTYPGSREHTWVAGERVDDSVLNAWAPPNVAWGNPLAPVSAAGAQSNISTVTDITGMTATFTGAAGRRILWLATIVIQNSVANTGYDLLFCNASNTPLLAAYISQASTTYYQTITLIFPEVPGAGSFSRKLRLQRGISTGLATVAGVSQLIPIDVGPSTP